VGSVRVTLAATDKSSGIASTLYSLNSVTVFHAYNGTFTVSTPGTYTMSYFSKDKAGNIEGFRTKTFTVVKAATTTRVASSLNPSTYGLGVSFTVTVTPSGG